MAVDRRILETLESCRPGSDDLEGIEFVDVAERVERDAALASLAATIERWDVAVSDAMVDVSVPTDLRARLLKRLAVVDTTAADAGQGNAATAVAARFAFTRGALARPNFTRRTAFVASLLAASLLVGLVLTRWWPLTSETPIETLADVWLQELGSSWQNMQELPVGYDLPPTVTAPAVGWQRVGGFAAGRGVAYKLAHATAGTARLFVVRLGFDRLPLAPSYPPAEPQSTTGGRSIGYWHDQGLAYVLVVDGNERSYRAFVRAARMRLAVRGRQLAPLA